MKQIGALFLINISVWGIVYGLTLSNWTIGIVGFIIGIVGNVLLLHYCYEELINKQINKKKKMKQDEIRSTWARVANRVEDVTKHSKSEFVNRNKPAFENDKFELEFEYVVLEAIKLDNDFRKKFEYCLKAFL